MIWATGFKTNDFMFPMEITGSGGRSLREQLGRGRPRPPRHDRVPGFPSMFLMYGPNTNTSGGSIIVYLEAQARYLRQALQRLSARGAASIEVRRRGRGRQRPLGAGALRRHGLAGLRLLVPRRAAGRIVANWPGYMRDYLQMTESLDEAQFTFAPLPERVAA